MHGPLISKNNSVYNRIKSSHHITVDIFRVSTTVPNERQCKVI